MSAPRAADLPVGSIVESATKLDGKIYAARRLGSPTGITWGLLTKRAEWDGALGYREFIDEEIQWQLDAGAQVLRVGSGSEH